MTRHQSVIDWLNSPNPDRAVHLDSESRVVHFDELAQGVGATAVNLKSHGISRGDRVAILTASTFEFITAFYGVLAVGAAASPIAPPGPFAKRDAYGKYLESLTRAIMPRAVVVDTPEMAALVKTSLEFEVVMVSDKAWESGFRFEELSESTVAMNQFTSGSRGIPSPVPVTHHNLSVQCLAMRERLDSRDNDTFVSWLPLHHDMGLVGGLVLPAMLQLDLYLMTPSQFVRNPERWLRLISDNSGTISAAPGFALDHVTRSLSRRDSDLDLDLSGWRVLIVGAERIQRETLVDFARALERYGFSYETIMPAYGLAEATLGVTVSSRGDLKFVRVDADSLKVGVPLVRSTPIDIFGVAEAAGTGRLPDTRLDQHGELTSQTPTTVGVVGCGHPLAGTNVEIRDAFGRRLQDGELGEIVVSGGTVSAQCAPDGYLRTQDAGFVIDGDLYVLGRMDSMIKVHGRALFCEDLESKLRTLETLPSRVAVVPDIAAGDRFMLVAESREESWVDDALAMIRAHCGPDVGVDVYRGRRGSIPLTSSGKPKRASLAELIRSKNTAFVLVRSRDPISGGDLGYVEKRR